jgi:hypothetical protein
MNSLLTVAFISGAALFAASSFSATVIVPGTANPWLGGMPPGSTASGDTAPDESPAFFSNFNAGANLHFGATGSAGYAPGSESGPEGITGFTVSDPAQNGIAGQIGSLANALLGVFLDDQQPDLAGPAPDPLDFTSQEEQDYLILTPQLRQPFFIGDGTTSLGLPQTIVAPAGATRLYLGITDGSGWYNNSGSFTVEIAGGNSEGPVLTIEKSGNNSVLLKWPAAAGHYDLEATPSLTNPVWQKVGDPTLVGTDQTVTDTANASEKYYRLHLNTAG